MINEETLKNENQTPIAPTEFDEKIQKALAEDCGAEDCKTEDCRGCKKLYCLSVCRILDGEIHSGSFFVSEPIAEQYSFDENELLQMASVIRERDKSRLATVEEVGEWVGVEG